MALGLLLAAHLSTTLHCLDTPSRIDLGLPLATAVLRLVPRLELAVLRLYPRGGGLQLLHVEVAAGNVVHERVGVAPAVIIGLEVPHLLGHGPPRHAAAVNRLDSQGRVRLPPQLPAHVRGLGLRAVLAVLGLQPYRRLALFLFDLHVL